MTKVPGWKQHPTHHHQQCKSGTFPLRPYSIQRCKLHSGGTDAMMSKATGKDLRLNNAGLLIYQAASLGNLGQLELVFNSVPQDEGERTDVHTS